MVFTHIYGALATLLPFCDHQDTESESWEMEIGVTGPILIQKLPQGSTRQQYIYPKRLEINIEAAIHFLGARFILLQFCDQQDTESE